MIGSAFAATLALASLVPQSEKIVRAPRTVDVIILSKAQPKSITLLGGGCSVDPVAGGRALSDLSTISVLRGKVHACSSSGPRKKGKKRKPACITAPELEISCKRSVVIKGGGKKPREYGRRLSIRPKLGHLRIIATIDRERYVSGVVAAEMRDGPPQAQIAQAILARTFALRALKEPRHDDAPLCDLTHCQVYAGRLDVPASVAGAAALALVDRTGEASPVYFHSTCGGKTVSPKLLWGGVDVPDLVGIDDLDDEGRAWCRKSPHFGWSLDIDDETLAKTLELLVGVPLDPVSLALETKDPAGARWRVSDRGGERELKGSDLHLHLGRVLGWNKVRSSLFVAERQGRTLKLRGWGLGHRAGLCQSGAVARAREGGQTAREILEGYFPQLELVPVLPSDP